MSIQLTPEQVKYLQGLRECLGDGDAGVWTDSQKLADLLKLLPFTPPRIKSDRELDYEAYDAWRPRFFLNPSSSEAFLAGCESARQRICSGFTIPDDKGA